MRGLTIVHPELEYRPGAGRKALNRDPTVERHLDQGVVRNQFERSHVCDLGVRRCQRVQRRATDIEHVIGQQGSRGGCRIHDLVLRQTPKEGSHLGAGHILVRAVPGVRWRVAPSGNATVPQPRDVVVVDVRIGDIGEPIRRDHRQRKGNDQGRTQSENGFAPPEHAFNLLEWVVGGHR